MKLSGKQKRRDSQEKAKFKSWLTIDLDWFNSSRQISRAVIVEAVIEKTASASGAKPNAEIVMSHFVKRYHPPGTAPGTLIKRKKSRLSPY